VENNSHGEKRFRGSGFRGSGFKVQRFKGLEFRGSGFSAASIRGAASQFGIETLKKRITNVEQGIMNFEVRYFIIITFLKKD
jgi:hypothetical protein